MMRKQLEERLLELQSEFAKGEQTLRDLEAQRTRLRDTMLRIDGAVHVLREVLAREQPRPEPSEADTGHAVLAPGAREADARSG